MPPAYKASSVKLGASRRVYARKRAVVARASVLGAARGYLRTGGFYGRFRGRRMYPGSELKFLDTALASTAVPAVGVVNTNLVVIPQGDTESNRNGRKVQVKSIWVKGTITLPPDQATSAASDRVRIMLVQDKQANGAVFTTTNVLVSGSYLAFRQLENQGRFNILYDQTFSLNAMAGVGTATTEYARGFNIYKKCNIPIEYDTSATTGAITTQRSNSLAILMISQANNVSLVDYNARVRYSDN